MAHEPGGGDDDPAAAEAHGADRQARIVGETRWPMAGAVLAAMVLTYLLPDDLRVAPMWVLPLIEGLLLVAVVVSDPGGDHAPLGAAAGSLHRAGGHNGGQLPVDDGPAHRCAPPRQQRDELVKCSTVGGRQRLGVQQHPFALLYWELDSGGAAARAHPLPRHPDLAFPQQLNPDLAPQDWRPRFIDYLYVGFTNAVAFSPTDTMPLTPWAKTAMAVQSLISLAILGLVVARAVNVFS